MQLPKQSSAFRALRQPKAVGRSPHERHDELLPVFLRELVIGIDEERPHLLKQSLEVVEGQWLRALFLDKSPQALEESTAYLHLGSLLLDREVRWRWLALFPLLEHRLP